ncbi:hypothetical protein H311_00494 [Anncaliia algerae PRA109]|nr:hypothetical protein H311_00494 [Anncaliia algerae PRA109]
MKIINERIVSGSTTNTDEHPSYGNLWLFKFNHGMVSYKYCFVYYKTGLHTQHVGRCSNSIKLGVKRKGAKPNLHLIYQ